MVARSRTSTSKLALYLELHSKDFLVFPTLLTEVHDWLVVALDTRRPRTFTGISKKDSLLLSNFSAEEMVSQLLVRPLGHAPLTLLRQSTFIRKLIK